MCQHGVGAARRIGVTGLAGARRAWLIAARRASYGISSSSATSSCRPCIGGCSPVRKHAARRRRESRGPTSRQRLPARSLLALSRGMTDTSTSRCAGKQRSLPAPTTCARAWCGVVSEQLVRLGGGAVPSFCAACASAGRRRLWRHRLTTADNARCAEAVAYQRTISSTNDGWRLRKSSTVLAM